MNFSHARDAGSLLPSNYEMPNDRARVGVSTILKSSSTRYIGSQQYVLEATKPENI